MAYIKAENLKYRYPNTEKLALDGLDFEIEKGAFIGVIGECGAGKSTLCQAFGGLVPQFYKGAYGGTLTVDGHDTAKIPVARLCKKVGLLFQNPFNQLSGAKETVFGEIAFGLQNFGVPPEEMRARVREVMELLDIAEYGDRNPFDLSGGQMQRVALAGVLAMHPDVVVLDEPTSQLDPQGSAEVFAAVDALTKSGVTIIMAEQKMEKLAEYCDKILLLHGGKLVAFDAPERVFSMENLSDYGVKPPVCTEVCQRLGIRMENGCFPATAAQAKKLQDRFPDEAAFRKLFGQKDGFAESVLPERADGAVFEIKDLEFHYVEHTPVLNGLSLTIDRRATAIVGQNGAGKTTLVKLLKGLLKPISGSIYYGGANLADKTVAMLAGEIGYVFQNPDDQIFKYHVIDEVMFGPLNIGMDRERAKMAALAALEQVGLSRFAGENPYDLELSERKLVAVASVLAMDTNVLILDEPTIAQDWRGRSVLAGIVRDFRRRGKTVVAILHDMDFAAANFERIIVMAHGEALAEGSPAEVFARTDVLCEAHVDQPGMTKLCRELGYVGIYI